MPRSPRHGPQVQGAGVHHNPCPGPANTPFVYGHVWVVLGLLACHPLWGVIALPLLTFYANIMAILGGAVMCYFDLGITIPVFLRQLQQAVAVNTFMVGMIKAPVFAFVIALVGCYEGFQVERNAASVGQLTTRSVVEGIFLVIVLDAAFSIMFSVLGV